MIFSFTIAAIFFASAAWALYVVSILIKSPLWRRKVQLIVAIVYTVSIFPFSTLVTAQNQWLAWLLLFVPFLAGFIYRPQAKSKLNR